MPIWGIVGIGLDFPVVVDAYGNWYLSIGVFGGTPGLSIYGGHILPSELPSVYDTVETYNAKIQPVDESTAESFQTGASISLSGNIPTPVLIGTGGGVVWGHPFDGQVNLNDFALEAGGGVSGGAISATYGFKIYDNGNSTPWIWQGKNLYNQLPSFMQSWLK